MRLVLIGGIGLGAVVAAFVLDRSGSKVHPRPVDPTVAALSAAQSPQLLHQAEEATRPYEQMLGQVAGVAYCRIRDQGWIKTMQTALHAAEDRSESKYILQAGQLDDEREFKSHIYSTSLEAIMFDGMSVYDPRCTELAKSPVMARLDAFRRGIPAG